MATQADIAGLLTAQREVRPHIKTGKIRIASR